MTSSKKNVNLCVGPTLTAPCGLDDESDGFTTCDPTFAATEINESELGISENSLLTILLITAQFVFNG